MEKDRKRPSWEEVWMKTAKILAERSHDEKFQVGTIVVSEDNAVVLSCGYNGNAPGAPHIPDSPEPGRSNFIHSEANALVKLPFHYPTEKVMYVTLSPCLACSKLIVAAKIKRVVYDVEYRDTAGIEFLKTYGVEVLKYSDILSTR